MQAKQILVIRSSTLGAMEARNYFDRQGIERDRNYLFFEVFGEEMLSQVEAGLPQLVFASHVCGLIDAFEVAQTIKEINPDAIVIALTSSEVGSKDNQFLDGVIKKMKQPSRSTVKRVVEAFYSGANREALKKLL